LLDAQKFASESDFNSAEKNHSRSLSIFCVFDKPTDFDDGLLSASEVAQLRLNADWVVLSACNTAAEEKPGAEALSVGVSQGVLLRRRSLVTGLALGGR